MRPHSKVLSGYEKRWRIKHMSRILTVWALSSSVVTGETSLRLASRHVTCHTDASKLIMVSVSNSKHEGTYLGHI